MKTSTYKYILLFGSALAFIACSTKKDNFVNRNWHAVNTEYNVLYNGNLALDAGVEGLRDTYNDNYWEVLPVERMQPTVEEMEPTDKKNPNFERAETKAIKAIQKHSMYIEGSEKNPQMDEAHLLLGKSRYYDNRFVPALEAFNYILYKYPTSSQIDEAKIWREKTNMRLGNDEGAIKNLRELLDQKKDFDDQIFADANATLGEAFMKAEMPDSAIVVLKTAAQYTKKHEQEARYLFIIGQIYDRLNQPDSSYSYYQQVIDMKRKSPRRYTIQAHAMQAGQFDYKAGDTLAFMEKYNDLLKDRENRPYLDIINYQVGLFYDRQDIDDKAVYYYNKSLRAPGNDRYQKASAYRNIGEISFENAEYATAGFYYDSTMTYLEPRTREFRMIKKKRDNLADVIKYEGIARVNDSILLVSGMDDAARVAYYDDYIVKLKEREEAARKRMEEEARKQENIARNGGIAPMMTMNGNDPMTGTVPKANSLATQGGTKQTTAVRGQLNAVSSANNGLSQTGGAPGKFYFYNTSTVSYGKMEFQRKWGKRPLVDNWRWSADIQNLSTEFSDTGGDDQTAEGDKKDGGEEVADPRYTPEYYIAQLPTSQTVLDSLAKERNFAYYQLGIIYKEKFKEYQRAADKLEKLLTNSPEERLILPSKYNLYKIYQIINPERADLYKNQILNEYPDSRYAEIIRNPELGGVDGKSPEAAYASLFRKYENGKLREVAVLAEEAIDVYTGEEILSKFELLKAQVKGRLEGLEAYKQGLNYVALTYPNSAEGKEAEATLKSDIPVLEKLAFGSPAVSYKVIFKFDNPNDPRIAPLKEKIQKFIKEGLNNRITLTQDIYTTGSDFIVVHGFNSKLAAEDAVAVLKDYKDYKIAETPYIISSEDYKVVQVKKNFTDFTAIK